MLSSEIREKFKKYFVAKNHQWLPSASLVPKDDPTVLFTTAGMHPLVPFLMGEKHPEGSRLANYQKCMRTDDIDEIGDDTHLTFFEMLGNWSLGDYWKKESIAWSWEFLTDPNWLNLDKKQLAVSVFAGDDSAPRDDESAKIWRSLGIPENRLAFLGKKDNWWGPPGASGPCGPDTEIFYWQGRGEAPEKFDPQNPAWVEIWNNVFMEYYLTPKGNLMPLSQKNVDTGMGFERIAAILQNKNNFYETDLFLDLITQINNLIPQANSKSQRIIADHIRAAVFLISDGVTPSNKDRGYVLRRLIRRAITYARKNGQTKPFLTDLAETVITTYQDFYENLQTEKEKVITELQKEEQKFLKTITQGLKLLEDKAEISGLEAFDLFQTHGFPLELTKELTTITNEEKFHQALQKHQELSRTASAGQFKGGLAGHSEKEVRLHTATHLLNAALRQILGQHVYQKGSSINPERTRFDFTHSEKMTNDEKEKVVALVNQWIKADLTVKRETMPREKAESLGALGVFGEKYPDTVSIYTIEDKNSGEVISREFCGGPHVENTSQIGEFKILKEESSGSGIRRIKATTE